ncbi:MAG: sensor histidine kinase [Lachnospiraceae bacterium]|nr:sensor histidine kinase [Lachnospiraceae bacterium]
MFKKIATAFSNTKLKGKLFLIYFLVGIVPMVFLVIISTKLMTSILKEKENASIKTYLNQAAYSVDAELIAYNSISDYLSFNDVVAQVLVASYENPYDLYTQIKAVIKPQMETIKYFSDTAKQVTIYANINGIKYEDIIVPIADIAYEPWYNQACGDVARQWYTDAEKNIAFCVRRMSMLDKYNKLGILYLSIDYNKLFEPLSNNDMGKNYGIFITDKDNKVVYSLARFEERYEDCALTYEQFQQLDSDSEYTVMYEELEETSWKLWLYKADKTILSDTEPINLIWYAVAISASLALVVGTIAVSKFITGRIEYLRNGMKTAESGNFDVRLEVREKDEIGELISGYNTLIDEVHNLIHQVYESKLTEKKHEMKALQNQINPHFLYNTLSLINWKALEVGNEDISNITLALSNFYRTSLNKGSNTMSVEAEISNVRSYIDIQLFMRDYSFEVKYDVHDEILKYETLNLILQPIVENAIEHGIDVRRDGKKGLITIKGWKEENLIYISVEDNGVGMDDEKAQSIITRDSKGYGIRNVNERIQLYYGEQYSLRVNSKINEGTCITVCIPAIEMKNG